jgi:hypothetical protein
VPLGERALSSLPALPVFIQANINSREVAGQTTHSSLDDMQKGNPWKSL